MGLVSCHSAAASRRLRSTASHLQPPAHHPARAAAAADDALWDSSAAPGIALLEHVNLYVGDSEGDRETAEAFYFGLLGLVPDPRLPGQYRKLLADAAAGAHWRLLRPALLHPPLAIQPEPANHIHPVACRCMLALHHSVLTLRFILSRWRCIAWYCLSRWRRGHDRRGGGRQQRRDL